MKQVIHVNQHHIKANAKGDDLPVLTVKTYKENQRGNTAILIDNNGNEIGRFVYRPNNPLSCGAKVWFESSTDDIEIIVE